MARRRDQDEGSGDTSLLPVMNIMLLMIPALLLAMEVARMGAIPVSPPRFADGGTRPLHGQQTPLELRVFIAEDGFELGSTNAAMPERIALSTGSQHDYAALEAAARRLHDLGAYHPTVRIDAEGSIPLSTLVSTMDALRGHGCHLAGVTSGEDVPPECLFWSVMLDPGVRAG